jgi:hypothetical protein
MDRLATQVASKFASANVVLPTVHSNGTSKGELLKQLEDAGRACRQAVRALSEAAPHGRDYYPQGPDAFRQARADHDKRVEAVSKVYEEVMAVYDGVSEAGE